MNVRFVVHDWITTRILFFTTRIIYRRACRSRIPPLWVSPSTHNRLSQLIYIYIFTKDVHAYFRVNSTACVVFMNFENYGRPRRLYIHIYKLLWVCFINLCAVVSVNGEGHLHVCTTLRKNFDYLYTHT